MFATPEPDVIVGGPPEARASEILRLSGEPGTPMRFQQRDPPRGDPQGHRITSDLRSDMPKLATRAKKLRKAAPMVKSAVKPMLTGKVERLAFRVRVQHRPAGVHLRVPVHLQRAGPPQVGDPTAQPGLRPLRGAERVLARREPHGRHVSRRRLPEQRHALLDRLAGPQRGADHPLAPRHGRPVLHLRADGRHVRQLRLHRPAGHRLEGGQLRDRGARMDGRAAGRCRSVARPLAEPNGPDHGTDPRRRRRRRRDGQGAAEALHAHPAVSVGQGRGRPRRAARRARADRAGGRSARPVQDPQRDARGEPAARAPRDPAEAVRARRHRPGPEPR